MKRILTFGAAALLCLSAAAIPAKRGNFPYTLPDGSVILIQNHGDEFYHYTTDKDGNVIELGSDGFFHPGQKPSNPETFLSIARRRAAIQARKKALTRAAAEDFPMTFGTHRIPVLLVNFKDKKFKIDNPKQAFDDLLNLPGYSAHGGTGSVRDFYLDNSGERYCPVFDVFGPFDLPSNVSTYGRNDDAPLAIFQAATGLDDEIDFSQYDSDGDGNVDMLLLYYAGFNQAYNSTNNNLIWPHQWEMDYSSNPSVAGNSFDGVHISSYFCTSELKGTTNSGGSMDGIGTTCHEFAHSLGLPDFYDTDYDEKGGEAGALYNFSTMCGGAYNNDGCTPPWFTIEERRMLGWCDGPLPLPQSGAIVIPSISENVAYMSETTMKDEYFVYECRDGKSWDAYLPEGLAVYHVDKSSERSIQIYYQTYSGYESTNITPAALWDDWETYNCINENGSHPCYYVVPSTNQSKTKYDSTLEYDHTKIIFPGVENKTEYTPSDWNGVEADFKIEQIGFSDGQVHFTVASYDLAYIGHTRIDAPGVCHPGEEIPLRLIESSKRPSASVEWFLDDEPVTLTSIVLTAGEHLLEARITLTGGGHDILEKTIRCE